MLTVKLTRAGALDQRHRWWKVDEDAGGTSYRCRACGKTSRLKKPGGEERHATKRRVA